MPSFCVNGVCVLSSADGTCTGTINFSQPITAAGRSGATHIHGTVNGLAEGTHDLRVCVFGDVTKGATSCGDVFEPRTPPTDEPLLGNVGSIEANADGVAAFDIESSKVTLTGPESIFGRSCVVVQMPKTAEAAEEAADGKKDSKDSKDKDAPVEPASNEPVPRGHGVIGIARMHADAMEFAKERVEATPQQPAA